MAKKKSKKPKSCKNSKGKTRYGKACTPQALAFGRRAKKARAECKAEPGATYFKCIKRQMK